MAVDFLGELRDVPTPGDRAHSTHRFRLPLDRTAMPAATLAALDAATAASDARQAAIPDSARQTTDAELAAAMECLWRQTLGTRVQDRETNVREYSAALTRYEAALTEAAAALQVAADHAQLHASPHGAGFPEQVAPATQVIAQLQQVANALAHLPSPTPGL